MVYENEFEGVEMAKRAIQRKEERKTQSECRHRNMVFKIVDTYTQDAREIRYNVGNCPDCGKYEKTVLWEAEISPETIRRI